MMLNFFSHNFNAPDLLADFDALPDVLQKAAVNTLNVVGTGGNRAAAKFILKRYEVERSALKLGKHVFIVRANLKSGNTTFEINIRQSRRGLLLYVDSDSRAGVITTVIAGRSKLHKGAFISAWRSFENSWVFQKKNNRKSIVRRTASGSIYMATPRKVLFGPSVMDMYRSRRVIKLIFEYIDRNFEGVLNEKFNDQFEKRR